MPWSLDNAEAQAQAAPSSFFIPPAERRRALQVGDQVKLLFRLAADGSSEGVVERMWVEVVTTNPYTGMLLSSPTAHSGITPGSVVRFGPEHVAALAYAAAALGYDPDALCVVLRRIAESGRPPTLLYRSDDGQWEAHDDDETAEEIGDVSNVTTEALGSLTDRFPAAAAPLIAGEASDLRDTWWRWDGSAYKRVLS